MGHYKHTHTPHTHSHTPHTHTSSHSFHIHTLLQFPKSHLLGNPKELQDGLLSVAPQTHYKLVQSLQTLAQIVELGVLHQLQLSRLSLILISL